jgi:hypothetical protein
VRHSELNPHIFRVGCKPAHASPDSRLWGKGYADEILDQGTVKVEMHSRDAEERMARKEEPTLYGAHLRRYGSDEDNGDQLVGKGK